MQFLSCLTSFDYIVLLQYIESFLFIPIVRAIRPKLISKFLFRPHLWGEELYTQMGFFLFRQFWPIDIFIEEECEWHH